MGWVQEENSCWVIELMKNEVWRLCGLRSYVIESYTELWYSSARVVTCSYLQQRMLTQICCPFHITEGTSRIGSLFLCLNAWVVCSELNLLSGERVWEGFDWQSSLTSKPFRREHLFSSYLCTSPLQTCSQTPGLTAFTWIGQMVNVLIKLGKTWPQKHVCC